MLIKQTKKMTDSERIAAENSNNQYLRTLTYAPIGMIIPFGGSVIPNAFLLCDGSALNKTEYVDLFNAIGYTYGGTGDTFKIPDFASTTLNGISVKFIIKTANGITEEERLKILADVDQSYNPESQNAQSGKAVEEALSKIQFPVVDQSYNPESQNAQSGKAVAEAVDVAKSQSIPRPKCGGAPTTQVLVFDDMFLTDENGNMQYVPDDFFGRKDIDDGTSDGGKYNIANHGGWIVARDNKGNLSTGLPVDDVDCANKKYVDDLVGDIETLLGGI